VEVQQAEDFNWRQLARRRSILECRAPSTSMRLAVLIGKPPASFSLAPLPLRCLLRRFPWACLRNCSKRRPDIAAAERQMAAGERSNRSGQGRYYPNISLGQLEI